MQGEGTCVGDVGTRREKLCFSETREWSESDLEVGGSWGVM